MGSKLSLEKFKERLLSGGYTEMQLRCLLTHQRKNNTPIEKVELVKKYLRGELMPESILPTATSKTITMPAAADKYPPITDPDTSDFGVAKKYLQVYNSAKERGIEFTLSLSQVRLLIKKKKCYYTDLPFDYSDKQKSLTFDRLDSKIGYVHGNVVACRYDVNQLKNILIEHEVSVFKDNVPLLIRCVKKWDLK